MFERTTPQAIFFDVDGVLIDSLEIKGEAFAKTFGEFPESHDEIVAFHLEQGGINRREKLELIFRSVFRREPTSAELDARVAKFAAYVVDAVIAAPEIRGASQALAHWSARTSLHAVSATPTDELVHILNQRGLSDFFTSVQGWPPTKSEAVKAFLDRHNYEPDRCLLVGDSREDFEVARSARIHFVQVSNSPVMDFSESEWVVRDLVDLGDAIAGVLRPPAQ